MTKYEKDLGVLSIQDQRRLDPPPLSGHKRNKKVYPLHWQIRSNGIQPSKIGFFEDDAWIYDNKAMRGRVQVVFSTDFTRILQALRDEDFQAALDIYAQHRPETASWPVRFINRNPVQVNREVLT